jgi:U2 small nuclear ribonucleoprotein A'
VLDLSDNEIKKLDNFPVMNRLTTLMVCNNYIARVGKLGESLVSLKSLVLTNNRIASLSEIDNIATITTLEHLVLLENSVVDTQHYRLYVIHRIPSLRSLDFRKVERAEREAARKFFKGSDGKEMIGEIAKVSAAVSEASRPAPAALTDDQKAQVRAAIEAATTKEEIDLIEKQLRVSGRASFC